jgi:hypothetical protein
VTIPESAPWYPAPVAPAAPPSRHRRTGLLVVLIIVAAVVLTFGGIAIVERLVKTPSAFPHGVYATALFTVGPNPTPQQVRDAAATLEADIAHLGGSSVQSAIHGMKVEIGVLRDEGGVLVPIATGRRLTPQVALLSVIGTGPLQQQAKLGEDCYDGGYVFCDPDRQTVGVPGETFLHGPDLADATATADGQTGMWSVNVSFTDDKKRFYTQAFRAQTGTTLATFAVQLDEDVWSLTPFTKDYALKPEGRIPNLTEVEAKRIAAVLRLSRSKVQLEGDITL